ncbi:hypothetical protein ACOME3_008560 [Neoechinorhynchus agilis]
MRKLSSNDSAVIQLSAFRYSRLCGYFDIENEREIYARLSQRTKLLFNVSGTKFAISRLLLRRYPSSLLANPSKLRGFLGQDEDSYFFERNADCFKAILNIYRTDTIRRPKDVDVGTFLKELIFFEFEGDLINRYLKQEETSLDISMVSSNLSEIWTVFTRPYSSKFAFVINVLRLLLIVISGIARIMYFEENADTRRYKIMRAIFKQADLSVKF